MTTFCMLKQLILSSQLSGADSIMEQFIQSQSTAVEQLRGLMLVPKTFFQTVGEERQYQSPVRERRSIDSAASPQVSYHFIHQLVHRYHFN